MPEWRCNCGVEFDTLKQIIAHYRKEHPEGAWDLYDQTGDVGDKFMNAGFQKAMDMRAGYMNKERADRDASKKLAEVVENHNRMARALSIVAEAVELARPK